MSSAAQSDLCANRSLNFPARFSHARNRRTNSRTVCKTRHYTTDILLGTYKNYVRTCFNPCPHMPTPGLNYDFSFHRGAPKIPTELRNKLFSSVFPGTGIALAHFDNRQSLGSFTALDLRNRRRIWHVFSSLASPYVCGEWRWSGDH